MWRIWLAALFWGLNWPIVKILLDGFSPWTLRAVGLSCGAAFLALVTVLSGRSLRIDKRYWRDVLIAGVLSIAGFNIFAVFAQLSMPASRAAILTYTMPLWSVLFARIILAEPIDRLRGISLAIGAAGLAILSIPFWGQMQGGQIPIGLLYVMGAAISWSLGTVYLKLRRVEGEPLALTTWQIFTGAVVTAVGMLLFEVPRIELSPAITAALAFHIVFPQGVSYVLWFSLITRVSASTAAVGTLLVPIFGVLGAVLLLGERPPLIDLFGFALILLSVLIDQGYRAMRT
ncbi:MAG: DMT family transporter [Hyphomicrobiaceae bacterium]